MLGAGARSPAATVAAALALIAALLCCAPAADAKQPTKTVRYRGYSIRVDQSWPVFELSSRPGVCVRFNRHAVYLGAPSSQQRCPAHVVGHTEAILLEPLAASAAPASRVRGPVLPQVASPRAINSEGNSAEFAVPAHRVAVTATWSRHPQLVLRALGVRTIAALRRRGRAIAAATAARPRPRASAAASVYTGLGVDVCSTPSTTTMSAWGASPYRAIGVYIGGANMACSQANLNSLWASQETAAGWHLILIYVGLQAPKNSCGCAAISPSSASAQGAAAASDAVAHAQSLGIAPGNPIYDDMEAYPRTSGNTSAVLAFLAAWTSELHSQGYLSGVYSSSGSGIADLVGQYGNGYLEPDELWIADWNGQQTTSVPGVPSSYWPSHQRIHQYDGGHNETWGGVTLNVDGDYVDASTAGASCSSQFADGTFVQVTGTYAIYRIAGGAPLLVTDWSTVGGQQPVILISMAQFDSLCPVPVNGTFLMSSTGTVYRVAGGAPVRVTNWDLFGGIQPYVTIDQWDIDNLDTPPAHLHSVPATGTVVEGLPSQTYWTFSGGRRRLGGAHRGAVALDDVGLAAFPTIPCVVPRLRHLTLSGVKKSLAKTDCRLGKVHRPRHRRRRHRLRVVWQIPRARSTHPAGWLVGVRLR